MELEFDSNPEKLNQLKNQASAIEKELLDEISSLAKQYDTANDTSILLTIKDLWYRKKYLLRIKDSLNKFAT
jgi:molecular chaperone HscB